MNPIAVDTFAHIVGGEPRGFATGATLSGFATDNREVRPGDLFLAIKGARVDGHDFVGDAVGRGAVGSLTERPVDGPHILVPNLVEALAAFGRYFRARLGGPVVGVTGSAGKTTAKEFIAAALSPLGEVLKTPGNRNTEYTSPLIWGELTDRTRAVVVEMSMRGFGQIRHLARISKPTIGVVTNIGFSHLSEVGSREGIAEAKSELLESLPEDRTAILWQEDPYLHTLRSKSPRHVLTFGYSEEADCRITGYHALNWTSSRIDGVCAGERFEAELPTVGRHIALGAAAALAVAHAAGVPLEEAARALRNAEIPQMRMEVIDFHGANLLLDTYNAAPPSMLAAIETFVELPCKGRRFAVIGEMRELGSYSAEAHRELGRALAASGIDEAIFYHGDAALSAEEARMRGMVVHEAHSLGDVAEFLGRALPGDGVLVKGSRSLELERAVELAGEGSQ
ncbi:MAG TPA: UDP-N-acetylmuramoyl-tripeptide--D-alanyl-D-alanine ligase [Fimbriimonadaceae bacterium]|nr:UDP-N-acetylmuramoyl-tripeptide--D-alanyl-D-alanine ligase [Fimbriimonadaceae bacterium]